MCATHTSTVPTRHHNHLRSLSCFLKVAPPFFFCGCPHLAPALAAAFMAAASSDVGAAPDLQDVIDDLALRFVINCPPEEQESFERLLFQVEAAYWFYDDNYREIWPNVFPNHTLLGFTETMFRKCELLKPYQSKTKDIFEAFRKYRSQIPTCGEFSLTRPISPICHTPIFPIYHEHLFRGAMLINESRTKVLCVKGWKAQSWGFPKGKMDRDEDQVCCATREVLEEVGFDISKKVRAFFLFFLFFSLFFRPPRGSP